MIIPYNDPAEVKLVLNIDPSGREDEY